MVSFRAIGVVAFAVGVAAVKVDEHRPRRREDSLALTRLRSADVYDDGNLTTHELYDVWMQRMKDGTFTPPKEKEWPQLIKLAAHKAERSPCEAAVVANAWCRVGIGLASRINNMANEVIFAMMGGYSLSFCNSTDKFVSSIWDRHFENPMKVPICTSTKNTCVTRGHTDKFHLGVLISERLPAEYITNLKRYITPQLFQYNDVTRKLLAASMKKLGIEKEGSYVGVHIRHGDKGGEAPLLPIDAYANVTKGYITMNKNEEKLGARVVALRIAKELRAHGLNTVYLASDDPETEVQLRELLGEGVKIIKNTRESDKRDRMYSDEESLLGVFEDLEALRRSAVFIGTASSNMGRLVYYHRAEGQKSITLDGGSKGWLSRHG